MKVDGSLRAEFGRAAALFTTMNRLRRAWATFGPGRTLKNSDAMMLGTVLEAKQKDGRPVTAGTLARMTRQSMPGVSQKLNQLEERGLLRRVGDAGDRRVVNIELTEAGEQMARQALRELFGRMEEALDRMGDERVECLTALMDELSGALEDMRAGDGAHREPGEAKGDDGTC